jgi:hypothetical protein
MRRALGFVISVLAVVLNEAINQARARLGRPGCLALFGPLSDSPLDYGGLSAAAAWDAAYRGNRPSVIAAATLPEHRMVLINLDGPFVNPRLLLGGDAHYFNAIGSAKDGGT